MIDLEDLIELGYYLELTEEFRNIVKRKILEKYGSLRQFEILSGIIGISSFGEVLKENRFTSLEKWVEICKFLNIDLKILRKNINKIRLKSHNGCFFTTTQFPIKPSRELASLVGHALGDGHINHKSAAFEYSNNSNNLQEEVLENISNIFRWNHYHEHFHKAKTIGYTRVVGDILTLAGAMRGNKIITEFGIPNWVINGSREVKVAFIRAMFDDESTIKIRSKEILFKLSKNDSKLKSLYNFMNQMRTLLEELGIEVTSIKPGNKLIGKNGKTTQLVLGIHGHDNFLKYKNIIGYVSNEKRSDIDSLLNSYQRFKLKDGRGQWIIYDKLDKPITIYNLATQLNMSYRAVYRHLHTLKDKNLVEKIKQGGTKSSIWRRIK